MTLNYKNDDQPEERLDPFNENTRRLYEHERAAYHHQAEENADAGEGAPASSSQNIDDTRDREQYAGTWATNVSGPVGSTIKADSRSRWRKRGPLLAIIGLLVAGGAGLGLFVAPAGALIHIKEMLVARFDTMSPVIDARADLILRDRMFSTNATCRIKVRCRYAGLTSRQMDRLRVQGAELLDADGKPVTRNALGRYTGGKTLVLPEGGRVDAGSYLREMRSSGALRDLSRTVFSPRFAAFNDKVAKDIRAKKRLVTNPDWGNGDEKDARRRVFEAVSGESRDAVAQDDQGVEHNPDGTVKTDEHGDPVKEPGTTIDFGDDTAAINTEAARLRAQATAGELVDVLPSDPASAAVMPEAHVSTSPVTKALGFLNPADFLVGLCTTYQLTNALVVTAQTIALTSAMRYASQFLSTADKIKAGDASPTEVEQAMTILQRPDQVGDAFGEATGYQYAEYGTVPGKPIASSARGNGVVQVMSTAIGWVNATLGRDFVHTSCKVLSNPIAQGALALTSFIPGGGQALKAVTSVFTRGAKTVADRVIRDEVQHVVDAEVRHITADQLKNVARTATARFLRLAGGATGLFLAGYLLQRYAIPYLARVLSGTELTGSEDGVTAMDTIANGIDATNAVTAQQRGLAPLSVNQAAAFNQYKDHATATYLADMRAAADPLDLSNPYSASNSLATALTTFTTRITSGGVLAAPAAILSTLNPGGLAAATAGADSAASCPDDFLRAHNLATSPFCNVTYGFPDPAMLENTDPNDVIDYMLDHHQITPDGEPITGDHITDNSTFATFKSVCVDNTENKIIGEIGDDDQLLSESCYSPEANNEAFNMYRLYIIDTTTTNAIDSAM